MSRPAVAGRSYGEVDDPPELAALDFEVVRPDPSGTIRSLAALGYTTESAVADVVDNSIGHDARRVDVEIRWDGAEESWLAVVDDGCGMSEKELVRGLTIGALVDGDRTGSDLGRFGMGLKTASFSQARQLVVATRDRPGEWHTRTWDIDHVLAVGDWQLLTGCPSSAESRLADLCARLPGAGTVVLWRRLTRLVDGATRAGDESARREFHTRVERVEHHLGMVFSRFLSRRTGPVDIRINDRPVAGWDPVMSGNPHVETLAPETPLPGVQVQGFVLPHRSRMSEAQYTAGGGPKGWLDQQGFYVFRRDRLIVAGDWLGLSGFRKDERHVLARVVVDLSADQDYAWAVDVRKSTATPPPSLAGHLRRVGKVTRERAASVISHRGRVVRDTRSVAIDFTWRLVSQNGDLHLRLNREHPLVSDLLARHPLAAGELRTLLSMIETTVPIGTIRSSSDILTPLPDPGDDIPDQVVQMASQMLEALVRQGDSASGAVQRVCSMPPFSDYPALSEILGSHPSSNEESTTS